MRIRQWMDKPQQESRDAAVRIPAFHPPRAGASLQHVLCYSIKTIHWPTAEAAKTTACNCVTMQSILIIAHDPSSMHGLDAISSSLSDTCDATQSGFEVNVALLGTYKCLHYADTHGHERVS